MDTEAKWKQIVKNPWFYRALGFLALSIFIWFIGPLIAISDTYLLDSVLERMLAISLILIAFIAFMAYQRYRLKATNKEFADELRLEGDKKQEEMAVSSRFDEAMSSLRSATSDKGAMLIQQLPWYILIGPPGSGKTTILTNSGLEFPLSNDSGAASIQGIGGTRHCDWWFSNEAVLIDTAGRFTTQDSDAEIDKAAWRSFINILKKNRQKQPVNGVLITVSISDMISKTENERKFYAKTIRRRIDELSEQLGHHFPIYFVFTKCDLIKGFDAFFDYISPSERAQVWGHTFELNHHSREPFNIETYVHQFNELIERINEKVITTLSHQSDKAKKAEILAFPAQLASYKSALQLFLTDIFGENKFQRSVMLRGVYYTSGTQQGSPFDSVLGSVASEMGIAQEQELHFGGQGKSYFIKDLLRKVIFAEKDLSTFDIRKERRMNRLQALSVGAAVIVTLSLSAMWYRSFINSQEQIADIGAATDKQMRLIKERGQKQVNIKDILIELNASAEPLEILEAKQSSLSLGLSQTSSFYNQSKATYIHTIETRLLPLIKQRLEEILVSTVKSNKTTETYSYLKAYLFYCGQHVSSGSDVDPEWIRSLMTNDWAESQRLDEKSQSELTSHLDFILQNGFTFITPDLAVVETARNSLKRSPVEELAYADLKSTLSSAKENNLAFSAIAGKGGLAVFKVNGKQSVDDVFVPGFYTSKGYKAFEKNIDPALTEVEKSYWVLGTERPLSPDEIAMIKSRVFKLYESDYVQYWQKFIEEIDIVSPRSSFDGMAVLSALADTNNPVFTLALNIARETNIISLTATEHLLNTADTVTKNTNNPARRAVNKVSSLNNSGQPFQKPGDIINRHFADFHALLPEGEGESRTDNLNARLTQFTQSVQSTLTNSFSGMPAFELAVKRIKNSGPNEFNQLNISSQRVPASLKKWFAQISDLGWEITLLQTSEEIQNQWQDKVWLPYTQTLKNRYPLDKTSAVEVELIDFITFFQPEGILNTFFDDYLEPFVEKNPYGWKQKFYGGKSLLIETASLNQLSQYEKLSKAMFKANQTTPSMQLSLMPVTLDANVTKFELNAGGQNVVYAHGPRRYNNIRWPLSPSNEVTKVEVIDRNGGSHSIFENGPWSIFHVFDRNILKPTNNNAIYSVEFSIDGLKATYEVRADSEVNPIGSFQFSNYNLPEKL